MPYCHLTVKSRSVMRLWKWTGLAVFLLAILLRRWLPGIAVALAWLYGIVVIFNLLSYLLRALKNRIFWSVRSSSKMVRPESRSKTSSCSMRAMTKWHSS